MAIPSEKIVTRKCSRCKQELVCHVQIHTTRSGREHVDKYIRVIGGRKINSWTDDYYRLACDDCAPFFEEELARKQANKKLQEEKRQLHQLEIEEQKKQNLIKEEEQRAEYHKSRYIRFIFKSGEMREFFGNIKTVTTSSGWVNVFLDNGETFCAHNETYETNMDFTNQFNWKPGGLGNG